MPDLTRSPEQQNGQDSRSCHAVEFGKGGHRLTVRASRTGIVIRRDDDWSSTGHQRVQLG